MRNRYKVINYYRTTLDSTINSTDTSGTFIIVDKSVGGNSLVDGEYNFFLTVDLDNDEKVETFRCWKVLGTTVSYDKRISPVGKVEHIPGGLVTLNDVGQNLNYIFDNLDDFGSIEQKGETGLTISLGGGIITVGDVNTTIADIDITLTDNSTNYVFFNISTLAFGVNTTGFSTNQKQIGTVITSSGEITSITDTKGNNLSIYTNIEKTKLAGIETGATADQTASEIKTAYELNGNTNAYTDAEKTKLAGIEELAEVNQTDVEIKTQYESNADTNAFTDSEKTNLGNQSGTNTGDETNATIKTKYELNANTNAYTDDEKTKLAGLESSHFLGEYGSISALNAAHATASVGDYANVDGGVGVDVVRYIWDNDNVAWIEQLGVSTELTDAQIKTQYENNADTNAFTDNEKTAIVANTAKRTYPSADETKLAGIETGAEVNTLNSIVGGDNIIVDVTDPLNPVVSATDITVDVGTTTTSAEGTDAVVTNSGTTEDAVFNFTIPRGDTGAQGIKGDQGIQGIQGIQGVQGLKGDKGDQGDTGTIWDWKGEYDAGTAYVVDDGVGYNGSTYICILGGTGNLPTDATYFDIVVSKGADGSTYTDAEIKTKYENNTNTNAYTDAEKTKVSNLSGTNTGDNATNTQYSSLVSNVTTNLSEGPATTTTVDVNSSDGTNATLVSASTTRAGLLTKAKFDEIVVNNAKVGITPTQASNITTNNAKVSFDSTSSTRLANTSGTNTGDQDLSGYQLKSEKDSANGYAGLDASSKINPLQLPSLAISETFVVASEVAQLALTVQEGDIAVRTDLNESYIALNDTNATMADWQKLLTPTDAVQSVAGKTGVVTLAKADVGLGNVDNTSDVNKPVSTAQQTEIDTKEDSFSKNTGFNKNLGTTVGTVSEGNHNHTGVYAPVLGADDNYVTDAEKTVIGNTSGTNTGDETTATIKTKLGISTLSGSNTGDQDLSGLMVKANNLSDLTNKTTARSNLNVDVAGTDNSDNNAVNTLYSGLVSNVSTNITVVEAPTNVEIQSSDGTNDTIAAADGTNAGVMTTTMYDEHVANNAKVSFDSTSSTRLADTSGTNTGDNATNTQYSGLATSKQDTLVSGTNIKTVNSESLLGSGDIAIEGAPGIYEATVGATGADYTTLGAAITDGKTRILVIADTTETGDITLPSNAVIHGIGKNSVNIDMGVYVFLDNTGANTYFQFENLKLTFANPVTKTGLFYGLNYLEINNVIAVNNSTTASRYFIRNAEVNTIINDLVLYCPDTSSCGIYSSPSYPSSLPLLSSFVNITIVGGGTSCYDTFNLAGNTIVQNLKIEGTFSTSLNTILITNGASIDGVTFATINEFIIVEVDNRASISNVGGYTLKGIKLFNQYGQVQISNIALHRSGSSVEIKGYNTSVSNVYVNGLMLINGDYNNISNCNIRTILTVPSGANGNLINNCEIIGATSITGNDTTISNSKVGAEAGGGSNTITVNSGANRTIISGCRTDAAISDSGTGTVGIGNVVY